MTEKQAYDVVILGTGPAGLQAAIHAARRKVSVLVLGKERKSSIYHHHVENYCCILQTTGEDIITAGRHQAASFGAELADEDVLSIADAPAGFASGALTMLDYARTVHLVCGQLEVGPALAAEVRQSRIVRHENSRVEQISGREAVEAVVLEGGTALAVQGVFVELGAKGVMGLAGLLGVRLDDEMKYIQTNKKMETNVPGIYAAGDITGPPWQVAKAVGEGCVAGLEAAGYAKKWARGRGAAR